MANNKTKKKLSVWIFIGLLCFLAVGGGWGGLVLMINPSGSIMQFPPSFLDKIPFPDFFIPGFFLCALLGIFPAFTLYGLLKKPDWKWVNRINIYKDQFWAWTFSLYTSIILIIWMDLQVMILGYQHFIQAIFAMLGVFLLIFTMLPSVKEHYKK